MITASCHCGAVAMELPHAPKTLTDCNCSICRRLGTLWEYYSPSEVKIACAPGATSIYSWGDCDLEFHTCKTCGCTTHWAPVDKTRDRMGINTRLMEPSVIAGVRVRHLNGAGDWSTLGWSTHPHLGTKEESDESTRDK